MTHKFNKPQVIPYFSIEHKKYPCLCKINIKTVSLMASQCNKQIKGSTMAHNSSSDSDDEIAKSQTMIFPHEKPIHEILGGGKGTNYFIFVTFYYILFMF
jgi:hypothetical protein